MGYEIGRLRERRRRHCIGKAAKTYFKRSGRSQVLFQNGVGGSSLTSNGSDAKHSDFCGDIQKSKGRGSVAFPYVTVSRHLESQFWLPIALTAMLYLSDIMVASRLDAVNSICAVFTYRDKPDPSPIDSIFTSYWREAHRWQVRPSNAI